MLPSETDASPPIGEALFLREDAIDFAQTMIAAAPRWPRPHLEKAYFQGMTAGWVKAGLLTPGELEYLRDRLSDALASRHRQPFTPQRHAGWWSFLLDLRVAWARIRLTKPRDGFPN